MDCGSDAALSDIFALLDVTREHSNATNNYEGDRRPQAVGKENDPTSGRRASRHRQERVNYREPSLKEKLRKGDVFFQKQNSARDV